MRKKLLIIVLIYLQRVIWLFKTVNCLYNL